MMDSNGDDLSGLVKLGPESQAKLKEIWADLAGVQIEAESNTPENSDQREGELNDLELEILGVLLEDPRNAEQVLEVLPHERSRKKVREAWRQMAGEMNRGGEANRGGETNRRTAGDQTNRGRPESEVNHGSARRDTNRGSVGEINRPSAGETNRGSAREMNHRSQGDTIRGIPARETNRELTRENEAPQSPDSDERRERVRQAWINKSDHKARETNRKTAEARRTHISQSDAQKLFELEYANSGNARGHRTHHEERINQTNIGDFVARRPHKEAEYASSSHDIHSERYAQRNNLAGRTEQSDFDEGSAQNRGFVNPRSEHELRTHHAKHGSCNVEYDRTCDENRANLINQSESQHRAERSGKASQTRASINPPSPGYRMPGAPIPLPRVSI